MATELLSISGSINTAPQVGSPSAIFSEVAPLDEQVMLKRQRSDSVELTVDTPVAVALGGLTSAHVVILKAVGGKVKARLTSSDGATQSVPVDSLMILISLLVPFTAIDLTRVAGTSTTVEVFLGEKS